MSEDKKVLLITSALIVALVALGPPAMWVAWTWGDYWLGHLK